jgi:DNA end-binding protein Ku
MAARAIASGTISFGLVSVPIKLYSATQSKSLSFRLLHGKDKSRLRQQYICSSCGEVVERDEMVKGYEYAKDQYAVLTQEEIKALDQQSDQSIEIEEFVPIAKVDPIYFERGYMLGPDKGAHKAYRLLTEAMKRAGSAAVAKFSTHGRQQLVLLRQTEDGLVLHTLHHADEVNSFAEVDRGDAMQFKQGEVDLAVQLIGQLSSDTFAPEKYQDEYRERALALIEQKVAGQEVVAAPAKAPKAQIIDLMDALKASLAAERGKAGEDEARARKPPRAAKGGEEAAPRKRAGKGR